MQTNTQSKLTPKQKRVLEYFHHHASHSGDLPSLRQAASELGVSHAAVAQSLKFLEEKGYVKRAGRYSRRIYLLNRTHETSAVQRWREVPIVGRVKAGLPMYAQQEWDGSIVLDGSIYQAPNIFALQVKGDSMKDIGMFEGDLAICEPRQYAQNGEIVVALIQNEEATVKRFFLHKDHIELRAENENFAPMRYNFNEILIQGKVIGIHRGPETMINL